jgi:hypothetical protein
LGKGAAVAAMVLLMLQNVFSIWATRISCKRKLFLDLNDATQGFGISNLSPQKTLYHNTQKPKPAPSTNAIVC